MAQLEKLSDFILVLKNKHNTCDLVTDKQTKMDGWT